MILTLFAGIIILLIYLAAVNKSLGFREILVEVLLAIFEWGSRQQDSQGESDSGNHEVQHPNSPNRPRSHSEANSIIMHDKTESIEQKLRNVSDSEQKISTVKLVVDDSFDFITVSFIYRVFQITLLKSLEANLFLFFQAGVESIIEDQVTSRFKAEQLPSWNLLTRTCFGFQHISKKLTALWFTGFLIRYLILLPVRCTLFVVGISVLLIVTYLSEKCKNSRVKKWLSENAMPICMRIMCRTFSTIIRVHNSENRAEHGGICVANHTSPIDVMILSCDNNYAMVGQRQGGFLGFLQTTLSRTGDHIWFERTEANDRAKVGEVVYPIAMKYDARLGDAFWNSSEQSYGEYLFRMMTSWAIICDVWYLPPMRRLENEDSIQFALRVKKAIAKKGGLIELDWDGGLKRSKVPHKLVVQHQKRYYDWLSRKTSVGVRPPDPEAENGKQRHVTRLPDHKEEDESIENETASAKQERSDSNKVSLLPEVGFDGSHTTAELTLKKATPEAEGVFLENPLVSEVLGDTKEGEAQLLHRVKRDENTS
ncbi:unnamed protein product [Enterobius vermicularis]|uniref:PlsC domain-containing protein n=1 Tax=Enterobius vermicularis TaxID=51028 RepID=A0A0N4V554_ENTVE|nr:unnamed protein product [Enterobius vermicularis]